MTNAQTRHNHRLNCAKKARQMLNAFGPEAAYTFLIRRGFSTEAACFIVFGE